MCLLNSADAAFFTISHPAFLSHVNRQLFPGKRRVAAIVPIQVFALGCGPDDQRRTSRWSQFFNKLQDYRNHAEAIIRPNPDIIILVPGRL